ncbi:MAG: hypothetical protein Q4A31_10015 [Corynebacterium sp.]|uniref:hypothetical protein n=1 Tax=Corynebacterium sp. TaxID=1720 RepID=UPI0026DB5109|nr:hypothetical protein [Corynebacterium sp.]MDO4762242.1 hypothetical protein [Corynebacterium sp.]
MELLKIPLWEIPHDSTLDQDQYFVRTRLFNDTVIAEFGLRELRSFFGIKSLNCLKQQFLKWHEIGAYQWNAQGFIHEELKPFKQYFEESKIEECYAPQPLPEPIDGAIRWGMKKSTQSDPPTQ